MNNDLIYRQAAIDALGEEPPVWYNGEDEIAEQNQWRRDVNAIKALPPAQPTLDGYNIEQLELIARLLAKENLPPERVADVLNDIGRIIAIVRKESEEAMRKAVEQCMI